MILFNDDCLDVLYSQNFLDYLDGRKGIIVTDPPFNIGYHYNQYKDEMTEDEYFSFLEQVFTAHYMPFVVIHYPEALYKLSFQVRMFPERVVSWVYNSNTPRQHRDVCFFGIMPDFTQVKQPYKNPNDKRIQARIENGNVGGVLYDWWNVNQVKNTSKDKTSHPCQMPVDVMKNIVGTLPKDAVIIDPFMGSGTTGVACKLLGYDFIGVELDTMYFDIAKKRIEQTGQNVPEIAEQLQLF